MSESLYKRIVESATEYAIFSMDLDRQITSWNPGAERLFGWTGEEAVGQFGDIIFPAEERLKAALQEIQTAHVHGSATDERWHVKKDGSRFWALGRMMSLTDEAGNVTGYVKILLDQTERKRYEQLLEKLNETLEERVKERTGILLSYQDKLRSLASALNSAEQRERTRLAGDLHDNLGQILAVCRMELELVKRGLAGQADSEIESAMKLVDEAIRYTRELMSDLKPPTGLRKEDLGKLMSWLAGRMKKQGLDVTVEDDNEHKPLAKESRSVLLQSVRELLFNIVKHSGVSQAAITLKKLDSQVQVTVKDSGAGFDPAQQELVQTGNGGFGLFNIQERMDLLGGDMKIDSRPGKGTTVTLIAPLQV